MQTTTAAPTLDDCILHDFELALIEDMKRTIPTNPQRLVIVEIQRQFFYKVLYIQDNHKPQNISKIIDKCTSKGYNQGINFQTDIILQFYRYIFRGILSPAEIKALAQQFFIV